MWRFRQHLALRLFSYGEFKLSYAGEFLTTTDSDAERVYQLVREQEGEVAFDYLTDFRGKSVCVLMNSIRGERKTKNSARNLTPGFAPLNHIPSPH